MEWLKRLSNAIDYIEDNLMGEISCNEAAKIACCSTYYFGRMFSYVAGISLSEYIRCRKMTQAAFELQSTGVKILDIALKYGYSSPTAFNRAFQNVHGIPPTASKSQGNQRLSIYLQHICAPLPAMLKISFETREAAKTTFEQLRNSYPLQISDLRNDVIVLPIFFLSTALFPTENLSGGLAAAINLNPFTHIINALRSLVFSEPVLMTDILPVLILLAVMCCGSFALALRKLKKEMLY